MKDFSVPMALVDFIPVILFTLATLLLLKCLYNKMDKAAYALFSAGAIMVAFAGGLKALYKLLYGAGVCDFEALSNMFFPTQSIGFMLGGLGLLLMILKKKGNNVGLMAVAPPFFSGTFVFVGMMVAGLGLMDVVLCMIANKLKKNWVIILFVISFICSLCMGYLSSQDFAEAIFNWIAEGVNVVGQGSLFAGVYVLYKNGLEELKL